MNVVNLREPMEKLNCTVLQRGAKNTGKIQGFSPFFLRDKRPKDLVEFILIIPCAKAQDNIKIH